MVSGNNLGSADKFDLPHTSHFEARSGDDGTQELNTAMRNREGDSGFELRPDPALDLAEKINPALRAIRVLGSGGMGVVVLAEVMDVELLQGQAPRFARQLSVKYEKSHAEEEMLEKALYANIEEIMAQTRMVVVKIATNINEQEIKSGKHTDAQGRNWREIKRQLEQRIPFSKLILGGRLDSFPVYFIQAYEPGYDLHKLMGEVQGKHNNAGLQVKLAILAQAARNIAHIAQADLIHRDIKPSNFMMGLDGHLKTLDFGLARRVSDESMAMTQEGRGMGTWQYAAPEVAQGNSNIISPKADVFSLGTMAVEMLTGRCPYKGENLDATQRKKYNLQPGHKPEPISYDHVNAEPQDVQRFIRTLIDELTIMIDPDPDKRPKAIKIAEFFHRNSYLAGRSTFEEFMDPASEKGELYIPRSSSQTSGSAADLLYSTPAAMLAALEKGAEERSQQYNFLDQYQYAENKRLMRTVFFYISQNRRLVSGIAGTAVLASSVATHLSRVDSRQEKAVSVAVLKPPMEVVPPIVKEQEPVHKEPEIIDGGGEVAMRLEDGKLKDIRLFSENPVFLEKDIIPTYAMELDGEKLSGAVFFCTPEKIMEIMNIDDPSLLQDIHRQGAMGQYMQSLDGASKFFGIGKALFVVEHNGRHFVYTDSSTLLETRANELGDELKGALTDFHDELPQNGYALEDIPLMVGAEGETKPYWPKEVQEVSPVDIQNLILQYYQQQLGRKRDEYQAQTQTARK